jgi:soluble lytic murein transglycosylase-like protein
MGELNTSRPFQERFLDNFDRSALRREVEAVKPRKKTLFSGLRKKYATYALGASLALGGIGAPLKMIQYSRGGHAKGSEPAAATVPIDGQLAGDIEAAQSIARQVAGGVTGGVQAAVSGAVEGVETAASVPLRVATAAPQTLKLVSEEVRQDFFHKEVPFGSIIYREAKRNNLRPELVAAVVQAESKFQPAARSGAGAIGLMQLVPRTGRWMGAQDLHNPAQNISAGAKYLKNLHDRFDGN